MARERPLKVLHSIENAFSPVLLLLATLILAADIVARLLGVSALRASTDYVRHLVLWISFAGAMITTCELLAGPHVRVARTAPA
jgi:TRAP-type C4-dicarboxylate transport system permease small subunit